MVRTRGFTLIEIMIAMGLTGMILGIISAMFAVSLSSWQESEAEMALSTAGTQALRGITEGLPYVRGMSYGIEDGLSVVKGEASHIEVLPLWREQAEGGELINLVIPRQAGSPPATAFVKDQPLDVLPSDDGLGMTLEPAVSPDEIVTIFYRPRADARDARLVFSFDKTSGTIRREYAGRTTVLPVHNYGTQITELTFTYHSIADPLTALEKMPANGGIVKAVGVKLTVTKLDRSRVFRKLVVLRNAGRAIVLTEPVDVAAVLPSPSRIKVLELRHLSSANPGDRIVLRAGGWRSEMTFLSTDTVRVEQRLDQGMRNSFTADVRFGISFLNPDVVVDADGSATPLAGPIGFTSPGTMLSKLKSELLSYLDLNRNGSFENYETLFIDHNLSSTLDSSDQILLSFKRENDDSPVRQVLGSSTPLLYIDRKNPGHYDDGEHLVLDLNGDGVWGGAFYDCQTTEEATPLEVLEFSIRGATLIVR